MNPIEVTTARVKSQPAAVVALAAVWLVLSFTSCCGLDHNVSLSPPGSEQAPVTDSDAAAVEPGLGVVAVRELPPEAITTLQLIENNGPFPYAQDGTVFHNYEGMLPEKKDGYYHEFTVATPGASDRGARRIVTGAADERYYTDDHYNSFRLVVE